MSNEKRGKVLSGGEHDKLMKRVFAGDTHAALRLRESHEALRDENAQLRTHIKRLLQHSAKRLDIEAENLDYACDEAVKEMDRLTERLERCEKERDAWEKTACLVAPYEMDLDEINATYHITACESAKEDSL